MNRINYQKELDKIIERLKAEGRVPSLFLHSCCGPCSSYVLEYLSRYFLITIFYFNPNIYPLEEFTHRSREQLRLIDAMEFVHPVSFLEGIYQPEEFFQAVKGYENVAEGRERCDICFMLRLEEAAKIAAERKFDYFTTTLTISPMKDAMKLNEIGQRAGAKYDVPFLPSDFKKRDGYKRSIELSAQYSLYRQDYCGCIFSRKEREMGS